jgi:hypothetical protein
MAELKGYPEGLSEEAEPRTGDQLTRGLLRVVDVVVIRGWRPCEILSTPYEWQLQSISMTGSEDRGRRLGVELRPSTIRQLAAKTGQTPVDPGSGSIAGLSLVLAYGAVDEGDDK